MSCSDPIRRYLDEMAICLKQQNYPQERILREVEDHLSQRVDELCAEGREPRAAAKEAIARFGSPQLVIAQFRPQSPIACEEQVMFRRSIISLAALSSGYAVLHVGFSFFNEPTAVLTYVKLAYAVIVVGYGALVLHWQWFSAEIGNIERCAIFIGGLGLIEIGTANMVWTAHLGLVSGDWEFYGFVGGAMISFLGALAAVWLAFPGFPSLQSNSRQIA